MQKKARSWVHFYEKKLLLVLIEGIFEKKNKLKLKNQTKVLEKNQTYKKLKMLGLNNLK